MFPQSLSSLVNIYRENTRIQICMTLSVCMSVQVAKSCLENWAAMKSFKKKLCSKSQHFFYETINKIFERPVSLLLKLLIRLIEIVAF